MSMVLMMGSVAYPPAMIRYEDGRVRQMSNKIVELLVIGEATVSTVVAKNEKSPEHGALGEPIEGPNEPIVKVSRESSKGENNSNITSEVREGDPGVFDPAMFRDSGSDIRQGKGRGGGSIKRG